MKNILKVVAALVIIILIVFSINHVSNKFTPVIESPNVKTEYLDTSLWMVERNDRKIYNDDVVQTMKDQRRAMDRMEYQLQKMQKSKNVANDDVMDSDLIKSIDESITILQSKGYQ